MSMILVIHSHTDHSEFLSFTVALRHQQPHCAVQPPVTFVLDL